MAPNQNALLAGLIQLAAMLVPLFRHAGRPDVADDLAAILHSADATYQEVIDTADQRTGIVTPPAGSTP